MVVSFCLCLAQTAACRLLADFHLGPASPEPTGTADGLPGRAGAKEVSAGETWLALMSTASQADVFQGSFPCRLRPLQAPQPETHPSPRATVPVWAFATGPPSLSPLVLTLRPLTAQQRKRTLGGAVTQPSSRSSVVNRQP